MELSLISLHKISLNSAKIIQKSKQQPYRFIIFGNNTLVLELKNYPESLDQISLEFQHIKPSVECPISDIIKNNDMCTIYNNSSVLDKQSITLDPLYAAEFSESDIDIHIINMCWSDPKNYSNIINVPAAKLTNFGQLDIYTKNFISNEWEIHKFNINKLWSKIFNHNITSPRENFHELKSLVQDYTITCCCWEPSLNKKINVLPSDESLLFCSTASGWIIGINVMINDTKFEFKFMTNLYKINCLESFRLPHDSNLYLIASDINGFIKLFKVERDNYIMKEIFFLWNKADKMSSNCFYMNSYNQKIIIVTTKGSHFLAFLLNSRHELIDTKHVCCDYIITGFDKASPLNDYVVATRNGIVKHIRIEIGNKNIHISKNNVKYDLSELENNQIIGLLSTPNFIGWKIVLVPRKMIASDTNLKHPVIISFYQLNSLDPVEILNSSKSFNMIDFIDCNEIIRLKVQKDKFIENYYNYNIEPIEISKEFLHRVRIRLVIVRSICSYNLKKMKSPGATYELEMFNINSLIISLASYFRIKFLLKTYADLNSFQKLAIKCARSNLKQYLKNDRLSDVYTKVKKILRLNFINLIEQTESYVKNIEEICCYCNQNIDDFDCECKQDHFRCCISFMQIKTMKMKYCERCKAVALDNTNDLYEILNKNEEIICPYCNYVLLNSDVSS